MSTWCQNDSTIILNAGKTMPKLCQNNVTIMQKWCHDYLKWCKNDAKIIECKKYAKMMPQLS